MMKNYENRLKAIKKIADGKPQKLLLSIIRTGSIS